jgi:hypothetical protein
MHEPDDVRSFGNAETPVGEIGGDLMRVVRAAPVGALIERNSVGRNCHLLRHLFHPDWLGLEAVGLQISQSRSHARTGPLAPAIWAGAAH